jgi:peptidyl-prolyl cis-trans isomerase D
MLDLMRRQKRLKAILWVVLFGTALSMLLFFVPGINVGGMPADTSAATVDGQSIPMRNFETAYRRAVENYSDHGRNKTDPETLKALRVPNQVLDSLITSKVIEIIAKRLGIEVIPDEVRQAVETHPYLQDQGKFIGIDRYKAVLAANNIDMSDFEEDLRLALLTKKVREILTDSMTVSDRELRDEFSKNNQEIQVDFVLLKKEEYKKKVKPAEPDLRAYFDAHKDAYRIKEKRRAQYLLVPTSQIIPTIKVTEEDLLREWDQRPQDETVEAAHILFKVPDQAREAEVRSKAEAILKRAQAGEDFSELAKKYSEDETTAKQGGYLQSFQRNQMVKEFENVAFSLKPGEISGLVRTEYGFHIIKVLRHETPTLESSRNILTAAVQTKKAQEIAGQKSEQAAALIGKQKDLGTAAKNLGIATEIKETPLFTRDTNPFEIGISQPLRDEVFELKEINAVGRPVEHPLGYAVPKLLEVQMPRPGEFSESRPQVEKDYVEAKAKELMQTDSKKLADEAARQGSLEKAAKAMGLSVKTSQNFKMNGTADPEIGSNPSFNSAAFDLAPGGVSAPITLLDNIAVLQVKSRSPFDEAAFAKAKPELRDRILDASQAAYFQDYVRRVSEELEKSGKIHINPQALGTQPNASY